MNLVDTPDVDIPTPPVPSALPGRFASAIQVIVCCGQLPTQTPIVGLLLLARIKMMDGDQIALPFFAALTLIDTIVVIFMMFTFLSVSRESVRQVFFGERLLKKEIAVGLALVPVVLIGTGILVGLLRMAFPNLHNVKISPFDSYFETGWRAAVFLFVAIVAGGVREELQRGFLLHRFSQKLGGIWVGQILFSIFFGLAHATQGWDVALATGSLGFFWGWLYIKRRSVAAAITCHAGFNATEVIIAAIAKSMGIPAR